MGFPSICYCIILPQPLLIAFHFLYHIKLAFVMAFSYLGICSTLEDQEYYSLSELEYFSPFSTHPIYSPSLIKERLVVVEFASFSKGLSARGGADVQCAICLREFKAMDEIRELGNCSHAFHKCCIDEWVDKGQITCPLCRAGLLPDCNEDEIDQLENRGSDHSY